MDIVIYMFKISCNRKNGNGGGTDGEIRRITITLMQEFDKLLNNIIKAGGNKPIRYPR